MTNKILVYTFYNHWHITYKILQNIDLPNVDKYYLGSLEKLVSLVGANNYDYVLGLGKFRKDGKGIRIEQCFGNKYGKRKILENGLEVYPSTWKLVPQDGLVFSNARSCGPCNRSAYRVCHAIQENSLKTKFAFIHIPSKLEVEAVSQIITKILTYP